MVILPLLSYRRQLLLWAGEMEGSFFCTYLLWAITSRESNKYRKRKFILFRKECLCLSVTRNLLQVKAIKWNKEEEEYKPDLQISHTNQLDADADEREEFLSGIIPPFFPPSFLFLFFGVPPFS